MFADEFAKRVKQRRTELGDYHTNHFCKDVGYSAGGIIRSIENGSYKVPINKLEAFSNALKVSPAYLLGWTDDPNLTHEQILELLNSSKAKEVSNDGSGLLEQLKSKFKLSDEAYHIVSKFVTMSPEAQRKVSNIMMGNPGNVIEPAPTVGKRIAQIRHTLKMSQSAFANMLGLSKGLIVISEADSYKVSNKTINLICEVFNINSAWLRQGIGDMFSNTSSSSLNETINIQSTTLKDEYDLTEDEYKFVKAYLNLPPDSRATCTDMWSRVIQDK